MVDIVRTIGVAGTLLLAAQHSALAQQSTAAPPPSVPTDSTRNPRAVQPERPTVATHAGTVAPGFLEIETAFELDRIARGSTTLLTPTVFKIGLSSNAQLSVFGA